MLKRWSIENFKSFRDCTDITLAPINIFAGANSSGKSTIIQSILVLKQTLEYAPATRAVAINGTLLKLGTFNDIKNQHGHRPYIGLGWQLEPDPQRENAPRRVGLGAYGYQPFYYYRGRSELRMIDGELRFDVSVPPTSSLAEVRMGAADEFRQLQPGLNFTSLRVTVDEQGTHRISTLALRRSPENLAAKRERLQITEALPAFAESLVGYDVDTDYQTRETLLESKPDGQIIGANLRHFFPFQVGVRYDQAKEKARRIAEYLCKDASRYVGGRQDDLETVVPERVIELIRERVTAFQNVLSDKDLFGPVASGDFTVQRLKDRLRSASYRVRPTPGLGLGEIQTAIEEEFNRTFPSKMDVTVGYPRDIMEAIEYCRWYFAYAVRYLGPLRDEPRPIYPLEALANPTEVGYKGEHTAAVLDLHRDLSLEYLPSSFVASPALSQTPVVATLHDAVVDWLSYLGVAEEVTTGDRGKIGHTLQVRTEGLPLLHDLTNVGVGVSQVLPIIVMALLADAPCLLIFEQPELHLHPKVQARLADFFLSLGLLGKQCLVETHSEYLVERLRRRIAEATGDALTNILKIYFTERVAGDTVCRPVEISKYGAIAEYPKDFFDQGHKETEGILQAARAKRLAEKKVSRDAL